MDYSRPAWGGSTDPPRGNHTIPAGTMLSITALPNEGYLFSYWLLNGVLYPGDESIALMVSDDMILTAVFQKQQEKPPPEPRKVVLQITIEPLEGGRTVPEPGVYEMDAGTECSITAVANEGYIFHYWLLNDGHYSSDERITIIV